MKAIRTCTEQALSYRSRLLDASKKQLVDDLIFHYEYGTPFCPPTFGVERLEKAKSKFNKLNGGPCCQHTSSFTKTSEVTSADEPAISLATANLETLQSGASVVEFREWLHGLSKIKGGIQGNWGVRFSYNTQNDRLHHHSNFGKVKEGNGTLLGSYPAIMDDIINVMSDHRDLPRSFVFYVDKNLVITCSLCQQIIWVVEGNPYDGARCKR